MRAVLFDHAQSPQHHGAIGRPLDHRQGCVGTEPRVVDGLVGERAEVLDFEPLVSKVRRHHLLEVEAGMVTTQDDPHGRQPNTGRGRWQPGDH